MHYGRCAIGVLLTLPLRRQLLARPHYSLVAYVFSSHVVYQSFVLHHRNALTKKTWEETVLREDKLYSSYDQHYEARVI